MTWALILHGGAGDYEADQLRYSVAFLEELRQELIEVLLKKGAREAVVLGLQRLEDHPQYNAGTGGNLQADGVIRLTASLMSKDMGFASASNLEQVQYPSLVANQLLGQKFPNLMGTQATLFAREQGHATHQNITEPRLKRYLARLSGVYSTVGVCALDEDGVLFSGTSTGGVGWETPGRMSDVATPCGTYCSDKIALSATGKGETILNSAILPKLAGLLDYGIELHKAWDYSCLEFSRLGGDGGFIGVTQAADMLSWHNTKGMRFTGANSFGKIVGHWRLL